MPFNPDEYLARKMDPVAQPSAPTAGFNPDAYLAKRSPAENEVDPGFLGGVGALARGGAQGLTMGFADEIAGGLGSAANAVHKMSLSDIVADYIKNRDEYRAHDKAYKEAHPYVYGGGEVAGALGGAAVPALALGKIGTLAGRTALAAGIGGASALGNSSADLTKGELGRAALDTAKGAAIGGALQPAFEKVVAPALSWGAGKLGDAAENLAVKATGATGKQAEAFAPETGRALLDEGVVKFGSSPSSIAERARGVLDRSGEAIETALGEVPDTIPKAQIVADLQKQVAKLKTNPSEAPIARKLARIIEDISDPAVPNDLSLLDAEKIKRGYQSISNYTKPNTTLASKAAAGTMREAVEQTATNYDPALGGLFEGAKKDYGIFAPVAEAAEHRASQLSQSPIGGLLDIGTTGAGTLLTGSPRAGVATAIARRTLAPRAASAGAVVSDLASKTGKALFEPNTIIEKLSTNPRAARFISVIQAAAQRGQESLAATHFILGQTQPEYQLAIQGKE